MNKRYEVLIPHENAQFFHDFYNEFNTKYIRIFHHDPVYSWAIFHADEEFMVVAKLKFKLIDMDPFGISIDVTN